MLTAADLQTTDTENVDSSLLSLSSYIYIYIYVILLSVTQKFHDFQV